MQCEIAGNSFSCQIVFSKPLEGIGLYRMLTHIQQAKHYMRNLTFSVFSKENTNFKFYDIALICFGFREAPLKKTQGLFGHCPNGGGGLDPCTNGLGHLF